MHCQCQVGAYNQRCTTPDSEADRSPPLAQCKSIIVFACSLRGITGYNKHKVIYRFRNELYSSTSVWKHKQVTKHLR